MATVSVTAEFAQEFEAERTAWFRKRFLWYTGIFGTINIISVLLASLALTQIPEAARSGYTNIILIGVAQALLFPAAFIYVKRAKGGLSRKRMISLVFWLLVISALLSLPVAVISGPLTVRVAQGTLLVEAIDERIKSLEAASQAAPADDQAAASMTIQEAGRRAAEQQGLMEPGTRSLPADEQDAAAHEKSDISQANADEIERLRTVRSQIRRQGIASDQDWQQYLAALPGATAEQAIDQFGSLSGDKVGPGAGWMFQVMLAHFIAAFFIPWTWREAIMPLIPLLVMNVIGIAIGGEIFKLSGIGFIILSPLIGLPGVLVVTVRNAVFQKKFTYKALRGRYSEMKRELGLARQIHEDLFPPPITEGPIRLVYYYEPMRQIGGDYLHARLVIPPGKSHATLHLTVMDVTGHGITAALTVNRLHGEMDRILAENPGTTPGQMLTGLNRYMHATLAGHSVYATALCVAVDLEGDTLRWASAGHPPAFLKQANGRIEELHSTTFVLGVTLGDDFDADEQSIPFHPGDVLLAYTDGAIESRNADGRQLGVNGLLAAFASKQPNPDAGWPSTLAEWVRGFRVGPSQDDILLVELRRIIQDQHQAASAPHATSHHAPHHARHQPKP